MSEGQTLVLGFLAGFTILLGLPLGRMRAPRPGLRQFLNALAIGILLFLVWDVLTHAYAPLDDALTAFHDGTQGLGPAVGYGTLFMVGIGVGLLSLVYYERWLKSRRQRPFPPGSMAVAEGEAIAAGDSWTPARRTALMIAIGIGLHNFGEGLAIGGSAASGAIGLATILVIGFGLHNATEGFGIVAPLAAAGDRPSWSFLLFLGTIGGGPTFVGTAIGRQFTNQVMSVAFLTLAAGSILYVVIQLVGMASKANRKELLCWGVLAGLTAGFVTDMIVTAGGA